MPLADTPIEATVINNQKIQSSGVAFMFTQRVDLFNQYGIGNYRDLLIQYQSCIRSARPKQKPILNFVYDELANGNDSNFEVSILFQSLVSCFKTFIKFSE